MQELHRFLYPHAHYRGSDRPNDLVFNANLQEFAQRVGYICDLETAGKVSPQDAYAQLCTLWDELKRSQRELGIQ
jgi:hypothetical protein